MNNYTEVPGGWKYYNHAVVPDCKPHEDADISIFSHRDIWKKPPFKKAFFARYTSNWDVKADTGWYWIIKDSPLDMQLLKAKHRWEIKKGLSYFDIRIINPVDYPEELYTIRVDQLKQYPNVYGHEISKDRFIQNLKFWKKPTFGAFTKEGGILCGYIMMVERDDVLYYSSHAVMGKYEKLYINSALIYGMLTHYHNKLVGGHYIVDGEKNVNHITNHQDFLLKKFGFRKVNCELNIKYRPIVNFAVNILYPFRKIFIKYDLKLKIIHKINGVLSLESIRRNMYKK